MYVMIEKSCISPHILCIDEVPYVQLQCKVGFDDLETTIPLPTNSLRNPLRNEWVRLNLVEPTKPPKTRRHGGEIGSLDTRTCQEV